MRTCPNCKSLISDEDSFCSNCGVKLYKEKDNYSKQIKIIIIGIILAAIILGAAKYIYDYYARESYKSKLEECSYLMIEGAADAEDACNKIVSVWNNCIWQIEDSKTDKYTIDEDGFFYEDFNDALGNLFDDRKFVEDIEEIRDNLNEVQSAIKGLQNPPKGCEQLHDLLMDFYDEYYELINCAIDPSGNLISYADDFETADNNAAKYYKKLQMYFD